MTAIPVIGGSSAEASTTSSLSSSSSSVLSGLSSVPDSIELSSAERLCRFARSVVLEQENENERKKENDAPQKNSGYCCDSILAFFKTVGHAIGAFFVRIYTCFKNLCHTPDSTKIQRLLESFHHLQRAEALTVPVYLKAIVVLQAIGALGVSEKLKAALREGRSKGILSELVESAVGIIQEYQFRSNKDNIELLQRAVAQGVDAEKILEDFFQILDKNNDAGVVVVSEKLRTALREGRSEEIFLKLEEAIGIIREHRLFRSSPDKIQLLRQAVAQRVDTEKALKEFFRILDEQNDACRLLFKIRCQEYAKRHIPVFGGFKADEAVTFFKNNPHNAAAKNFIKILIENYFNLSVSFGDILDKIEHGLIEKTSAE